MRRVVIAALLSPLFAAHVDAATLYVCATGGDDSRSYATAQTEGTPWATIGRAAWGSTNRSSLNASAAAQAGDTVLVCAGTYAYGGSALNNRWSIVYHAANSGTSGNPITFTASGTVTLTSAAASPVIGCDARNYIKWTGPFNIDEDNITITPDTGPVVMHDGTGCEIDGLTITGNTAAYNDNHNGIRIEGCTNCRAANNTISGFRKTPNNHNGSGVTMYSAPGAIIENNHITDSGSGVFFKDSPTGGGGGATVRRNLINGGVNQGVVWSIVNVNGTPDSGSNVYSNIIVGGEMCVNIISDDDEGPNDDDFINNVCVNQTQGALYVTSAENVSGFRFWNNIVLGAATAIYFQSGDMPADTVIDAEHNVYRSYTTFYSGSSNRTLASFKATYANQEQASPAGTDTDPGFVDAGASDYRLCTGSGTPEAGCAGASGVLAQGVDALDLDNDASTSDNIPAGAYVTGSETIGVDSGAATVPDAPTSVSATTSGSGQCVVIFTAGSNGGSPITGFTATSTPGSITGTGSASPITVSGLTNGVSYTFTVTATNAEGTSSASSASNACTPVAPSDGGGGFRLRVTGEAEQTAGGWSFSLREDREGPRGVPFTCRVTGVSQPYADGDLRRTIRCDTNGPADLPTGTVFEIPRAPR